MIPAYDESAMAECWHTSGVFLDSVHDEKVLHCKACGAEIEDPEFIEQLLEEEMERAADRMLQPWPPPLFEGEA